MKDEHSTDHLGGLDGKDRMERRDEMDVTDQIDGIDHFPDCPLVTFALLAYNQERFISEAVEGAFSQTYSPLEIILSDDCSTDRTFEIMKEMAATYTGPHNVILNRNEKNLGIGGHINRIMEISHGDLVVGAAGDDISLPERTDIIVNFWRLRRGKALSIQSEYWIIDENGNSLGVARNESMAKPGDLETVCKKGDPGVSGCTQAWHRSVFSVFGPIDNNIVWEDQIIPFRAMILGELGMIDRPLVRYRRHGKNWSSPSKIQFFDAARRSTKILLNDLAVRRQYLADLTIAYNLSILNADKWHYLITFLENEIATLERRWKFVTGKLLDKVNYIIRHHNEYKSYRWVFRITVLAFTPSFYNLIRNMISLWSRIKVSVHRVK